MRISGTIVEWLKSFGDPVADTAFPPRKEDGTPNTVSIPYNVFLDKSETNGGDEVNLYTVHDLTIERYTQTAATKDFEQFLYQSGLHFIKYRNWLKEEQLFLTVFEITTEIITKNGDDGDVGH